MQLIFKIVIFILGLITLEMAHADGWRGGDRDDRGGWRAMQAGRAWGGGIVYPQNGAYISTMPPPVTVYMQPPATYIYPNAATQIYTQPQIVYGYPGTTVYSQPGYPVQGYDGGYRGDDD